MVDVLDFVSTPLALSLLASSFGTGTVKHLHTPLDWDFLCGHVDDEIAGRSGLCSGSVGCSRSSGCTDPSTWFDSRWL